MSALDQLLNRLWNNYTSINKPADAILRALEARGERVVNDHVAFRTFDDPKIGIARIARTFVDLGYEPREEYDFPEKKLRAAHYEHTQLERPKIFISELKTRECSSGLKRTIKDLVAQIPKKLPESPDFSISGVVWKPVLWKTYLELEKESEYAAWVAAFGFRVNHFTVFFNALKTFKTLVELNMFLKTKGFKLNSSGGEIKGSAKECLEQSSTLANLVEVAFQDRSKIIPGCYYEFARRYPLPDGRLFEGFIAKSADKIFESTDRS